MVLRIAVALLLVIGGTGCVMNHQLVPFTGQTTLLGCLGPGDTPDSYILSDYHTGAKRTLVGNPDLQLHALNHTVRVVGFQGTEAGIANFKVIEVDHIASWCHTPGD